MYFSLLSVTQKKKNKVVETAGTPVRPCPASRAVVQSQQKVKIFKIPREDRAFHHGPWYSAKKKILKRKK